MEVSRTATPFAIDHDADVGAVRRHATILCAEIGLDETETGRVALIVTELGTNVLRHAHHGGALISALDVHGVRGLTLAFWDRGPGMHVSDSLQDGVSTGGTRGVGLGAVSRMSSAWDAYSLPGSGSVVVAKVLRQENARSSPFTVGGICVPCPGERVSGDRWEVHAEGDVATVLVCDGLGHGPGACEAAAAVSSAFLQDPTAPLPAILERADRAAHATRGAAATIVRLERAERRLVVCGAGNVTPWLVARTPRQLVVQHGTLGQRLPRLREEICPLDDGDHVVVMSDGLKSRWDLSAHAGLLDRDPDLIATVLWRDFARGKDDATAVVIRGRR